MNSEALVCYIPFCQHKVVDIGGRELNFLVEDIDVSVLRCLILLYLPYKIDPGDKRTFFLVCTRLISCIAEGGFVEPLRLLVDLLKRVSKKRKFWVDRLRTTNESTLTMGQSDS
jgi:hypothetical protein